MVSDSSYAQAKQLPWWTWVAPFFLFHVASQLSLSFKFEQGVTTLYLPTAIALVLVNWWGFWRVVPCMYIVVILNTYYWGIEDWYLWPVHSAPEVIGVILSYGLFKLVKGQYWLPSTRHLILFIVMGIAIPITIELLLLQAILIYFGHHTYSTFFNLFAYNWLGEFMANVDLTLPLLYSVTPYMQRRGLLLNPPSKLLSTGPAFNWAKCIELVCIHIGLLLLSFSIPFEKYWFAYGIITLYVAIRFGFGAAIFSNLFVFIITYIVPQLLSDGNPVFDSQDLLAIFLGNILLSVFVAITGRVITDLWTIENTLQIQNQELEATNKELDRFVYSASHDLSAPLKSILGLVTISKLEAGKEPSSQYLNEIERSVLKLDSFIGEILDYSRNKRLTITTEQFELKALCQEILENLKYLDDYHKIEVDMNDLNHSAIRQDKTRLKIILSNLISNAIKFQKKTPGHKALIKISAAWQFKNLVIRVEDNGEGIRPEFSPKIFEMFYRASGNSSGSGLGLYIARESAVKIGGRLSHQSEYGKGSVFILEIPET